MQHFEYYCLAATLGWRIIAMSLAWAWPTAAEVRTLQVPAGANAWRAARTTARATTRTHFVCVYLEGGLKCLEN